MPTRARRPILRSLRPELSAVAAAFNLPEPACGWEVHDKRVAEQLAQELADEKNLEMAYKLDVMGVPRTLHAPILAGPERTAAVEAARAMYQSRTALAVFSGRPGTGKTLAAATWLLHAPVEYSRRNIAPRKFVTAADFVALSNFDREQFGQVAKAAYLVLDDMGQEYTDKRAYSSQRIEDLIARRHADALPTIITTNLTVQQICKVYGERVASRLNDAVITTLRGERDMRVAR